MNYPTECIEILVKLAVEGRLSKATLSESLVGEAQDLFLGKCAAIEKQFTEQCTSRNDPCLESGCAMDGEVCLSALQNFETEYQKACGAEWRALFANPANRIPVWRS